MAQEVVDGRRARGDESRREILTQSIAIASVDGLEGLSIGRLATAAGHSKSGVATLFGSKLQLQVATVAAAREVFIDAVIAPVRARTPRGLARVVDLLAEWLAYSRGRVFPGGCFFAAASVEFDSKPGPVRDAVTAGLADWEEYLARSLEYARPELAGLADSAQVAYELTAFLEVANTRSILHDSAAPYRRAATAARDRLRALGAPDAALAPLDAWANGEA